MRVLHLISTSVFSGAENVACQIINMFKNDKKMEMYYVSVLGANEPILKDRDINYIELKKFNFFCIKKIVDKYNPDIIHAHDIKASFYASFFFKKARIISHVHNNHEGMRKPCPKSILFNIASNRFSKIIWVSRSAYDNYYFKKKVYNKSTVLYNVINTKEIIEKVSKDETNYNYDLVFLGRLTYQKNPQRLIEIAREIVKRHPQFKMAIIGTGDLSEQLKNMINEYRLRNNVIMLGYMNNPYKALSQTKMLILTSRFEGTPMVVLESMTLGTPVISTFTDGVIDIIKNGKNGFLCNTNDEFVSTINSVIFDNKILKKLKIEVQKTSEEINNMDYYKKEIEKAYKY